MLDHGGEGHFRRRVVGEKSIEFCMSPIYLDLFELKLKDHTRLTYYVGNSPRRLWVKRATYTSSEWVSSLRLRSMGADLKTIIPEHKLLDLKSGADRLPNAFSVYCQKHPDLQYLSDEDNLPISPLPPFVHLANLPSEHWPNIPSTRRSRVNRQPLKSQIETFQASGYKANRD